MSARLETWHNGYTAPLDWKGTGQPNQYTRVDPTLWTVLLYFPNGDTKVYHFDSPAKRRSFIDEFIAHNGPWQYRSQ